MKRFSILLVLTALTLIIAPLASQSTSNEPDAPKASQSETTADSTNKSDYSSVTVFMSKKNDTATVSSFEYVCGSVAAEMPLTYHEEALKAQAVACFTNACRLKDTKTPSDKLMGADISDDSGVHQGYLSVEERKEKWGDSYDKYEKKLEAAVNAVSGEALKYKDEFCIAAFFALSCGTTEDAENIWGTKVPYLVSVKSAGDSLSPTFVTTTKFSHKQVAAAAKKLGADIKDNDDLSSIITDIKTSDAKTVLSAKLSDKSVTGAEIREAFSLRSACFTVTAAKDSLTFRVTGYGHGAGMSQYGADYMARQGSDYKEILKHYYKGADIVQCEE